MKIYHNPRCSKSRQTLKILHDHGLEPEIVLYLETPPSKKEIQEILKKLNISPEKLVRKGEKIFKEHFKGKEMSDEEWIDAMVKYPKLIERPIVIDKDKAVLGRPPENVIQLIPQ